ncbi:MAG: cysteine--tRNA ligase [Patescibacteria group bacterium]|mgnify:CR=1 FL=1
MEILRLYNSRTRKKETFTARNKQVGMYVCGITPYGVTHLGHAFTYTFFDVLGRYLRHNGYRTTSVQNLTDIDDDILKRAREEKRNWRELGETNVQQFLDDQQWLGNIQPDIYPRASDHIAEIAALVKKLLRKGAAYEKNNSVYFDARRDKKYGALSRLPYAKMLATANERGNHPDDPNKKDPLDFVLWQAKKPGEPSWDSPWGAGRPGWHIECSAMATKYLGKTIDIHGGGGDLIFPHHESEEAQSRSANGKSLARFWVHAGMLKYKGEKMSKSLGNLVLISDLKKRYTANAVRMYLLSRHYRSSFEFFERDMEKAKARERLFQKVWRGESLPAARPLDISAYRHAFFRALSADMQTPEALRVVEALAREVVKEKNRRNITDAKAFLNTAFSILGLQLAFQ